MKFTSLNPGGAARSRSPADGIDTVSPADYSQRLYDAYIQSHVAHPKSIGLDSIRRDFPIFKYCIGKLLPFDHNAPILDAGCGYGSLVYYLHTLGYRAARGVDRGPEVISIGRSLGIPGLELGDFLERLDNEPEQYELITAIDVMEHQKKEQVLPALDLIFRALRPGGAFVMQTPNAMSHYGQWCRYGDFTHEFIFDGASALQCLGAAGFTRISVKPLPPIIHGAASAIRRLYWMMREPLSKLSFALECGWQPGQVFTPNLVAVGRKPVA